MGNTKYARPLRPPSPIPPAFTSEKTNVQLLEANFEQNIEQLTNVDGCADGRHLGEGLDVEEKRQNLRKTWFSWKEVKARWNLVGWFQNFLLSRIFNLPTDQLIE